MPKHTRYGRDDSNCLGRAPFRLQPRSDQNRDPYRTKTFQEVCGKDEIAVTLSKCTHDIGRSDVATATLPDVNPCDSTCEVAERNRSQQIAPDHCNGESEHGNFIQNSRPLRWPVLNISCSWITR